MRLARGVLYDSCSSLWTQDPDQGGIADRPDDMPDVWHTVFGLAGQSPVI